MSALAEALVAAQRRALSALEKQYAAVKLEADEFRDKLVAIGLTDDVDADRLIAALDLIRDYGAALPAEASNGGGERPEPKATDAQIARIQRDLRAGNQTPLAEQDLRNLSRARASTLIEAIAAGSYNPAEWDVAF